MKLKADISKKRASGNAIRTILRQELQNLETNIENRFVEFDKKVDQKFVEFDKKVDQKFVEFDKKVDQKFVEFDKKVDQKFVEFETKMDFKLGDLEIRVDEKAKKYRDQILTSNDKLMKELEGHREEREIGNSQTREKLEDHENRIKVLESA